MSTYDELDQIVQTHTPWPYDHLRVREMEGRAWMTCGRCGKRKRIPLSAWDGPSPHEFQQLGSDWVTRHRACVQRQHGGKEVTHIGQEAVRQERKRQGKGKGTDVLVIPVKSE